MFFHINLMVDILACKWITIILRRRVVLALIIVIILKVMSEGSLASKPFKLGNDRILLWLNLYILIRCYNIYRHMFIMNNSLVRQLLVGLAMHLIILLEIQSFVDRSRGMSCCLFGILSNHRILTLTYSMLKLLLLRL